MMDDAEAVLGFWFDEVAPERRFKRDEALDAEIRARFGELHARLARETTGGRLPDGWRDYPRSVLATVVVLDQFSRNLYRDDPRAFQQDGKALALAKSVISRGDDALLTPIERHFLYLPLMHAEDREAQEHSVQLYEALGLEEPMDYARRHRDVIVRFGRFPQRNAALGRPSTPEEKNALESGSARF